MTASQDFYGPEPANGVSVHYNMPARVYHSDADGPRLSQSLATAMCQRAPLHAWQTHPLLGARPYTYEPIDDDGTILHSLVLEPDSLDIYEIDASNIRTKDGSPAKSPLATAEGKAIRDAALAQGRIPILSDKLGVYRYKAKAIRSRLYDSGLDLCGRSEVVIYWVSNGVRCRARIDHLIITPERIRVVDLKTTGSADPRMCARQAWELGYDIQGAAYVEAVEAAFPDYVGRVDFLLAFGELEKPYATMWAPLEPEFARAGEQRWVRGRDRWAECLRTDKWGGYPSVPIAMPAWAKALEMVE